jgi:hypothetical protein
VSRFPRWRPPLFPLAPPAPKGSAAGAAPTGPLGGSAPPPPPPPGPDADDEGDYWPWGDPPFPWGEPPVSEEEVRSALRFRWRFSPCEVCPVGLEPSRN